MTVTQRAVMPAGEITDYGIIYLARTSFQVAGKSTGCDSRSRTATVC